MAIKGEVHDKSMVWAPKITLNDGRYVIRPFECKIVGTAEGLARVRASIHTFFAIFDNEEWRIITLFVNHLDSKTKYTDLFAASCGSIGDFTDIAWWWGLCYDSANETFHFPCTKSWWNLLCTSASFWPFLLRCQGAPHWCPPFYTSPLPAHLAAAYHHPISFFKTASTAPLWNSKILARRWWNNCVFIHPTDGNLKIQSLAA